MSRPPTLGAVASSLPTSTNAAGDRPCGESDARFEVRVTPDGRIDSLTEMSATGGRRPLQPFSSDGIAVLKRGRNIEYRFDEERRLRDLPYLDVLAALRQEILLTAHKIRHGELLDEPDSLPVLKELLHRIEAAAEAFRCVCEAPRPDG